VRVRVHLQVALVLALVRLVGLRLQRLQLRLQREPLLLEPLHGALRRGRVVARLLELVRRRPPLLLELAERVRGGERLARRFGFGFG